MQLKTYTGLWNVENRLYKFYDVNLPFPIPVKQLGVGVVSFVLWFTFLHFTHLPFKPPFGQLIWFVPPAALTWWSNRPVAEGKQLYDFLSAQASYIFNSKHYAGLVPTKLDDEAFLVRGKIWRKR